MSVVTLAIIASIVTWGSTAIGAASIFLFRKINQKLMDGMLGFAAGVMISASFFSLLIPALEYAGIYNPNIPEMIVVAGGFVVGVIFLFLLDRITPHMNLFQKSNPNQEKGLRRSFLLFLAVTIHNVPEGIAVGVAIGAYDVVDDPIAKAALLSSAIALLIGIGIQNIPEGAAISFPLHREGLSKKKAFIFGQFSALVEPIGIILGILLIHLMQTLLPFALAFAAGAMMYVVVEELIPESQKNKHTKLATVFTMIGLVVMMILDVVLG